MKNKLYIFSFLILLLTRGVSAQATIDSLSKMHYESSPDSIKIKILFSLIQSYGYTKVDTCLQLAKTAREISIANNDAFNEAVAVENMAHFYNVQSNYQQALKYDLESLELYKKAKYGDGEVIALNNIGEDYFDLDLFNDAYDYYQKSLRKAQEVKYDLYVAIGTYNIGRVLRSMGQTHKALEYIVQSKKLSEAIGDTEGQAYALNDIAEIYISESRYKEALDRIEQALSISKELDIDILQPELLQKKAKVYMKLNDYNSALRNLDKSFKFFQMFASQSGIAETYLWKGVVMMKMQNYDSANTYMVHSLSIAQEMNNKELIIECFKELSRLYEKRQMFEHALSFYKQYKAQEDSLFGEKKKEQFAQIQIKYETVNKDMEIALLNQQEQERAIELKKEEFFRNILAVILAFTALLLITAYRSGRRRKRINRLLVLHQKEMEQQSKKMESLLELKDKFFSILSHDLRSPIHALMGIFNILDKGNLTQEELRSLTNSLRIRLDKTKALLDNLLDWALVQMDNISLQEKKIKLQKVVEKNLDLYRDATDKHIDFINKVSDYFFVTADANMLDLILRNLISNAVKFTDNGGQVVVDCEEANNDELIVKVVDSGIGMSDEQRNLLFNTDELHSTAGTANEQGTGLGLKLCKEFVERMGGQIWVESMDGIGTTFLFTIKKAPLF